jgi:4-hydroxybenzoate polyprenyltransferase
VTARWEALRARLDAYERLVRLDKPIGILLLLWPTLWGLWMAADGRPGAAMIWIFVLGTALMRSAGCAVNDWADRHFDAHVKRTAARPLARGEIAPREALLVAAVLALISFLLILPLHPLTRWMSVPALLVAVSYPFTKRFFALPQAYLGIAFGFGIPMAFAAQRHEVPLVAWLLVAANVCWALAYDTEYAMVDRDDDLKIGIRTAALTFGRYDVKAVMACYGLFLAMMTGIGLGLGLSWIYLGGIAVAAGIALYHYHLIRHRDRMDCFKAFRHNNWLGLAVFLGAILDYGLLRGAWPRI